jgi:Arc/MetJ-type ribon-helix-helix transcriptional regulator
MFPVRVGLPSSLLQFTKSRALSGGYANTGEYVRALIRADEMRKHVTDLDARLQAWLGYGAEQVADLEQWQQLRDEFRRWERATGGQTTGRVVRLDRRWRRKAPPGQTA